MCEYEFEHPLLAQYHQSQIPDLECLNCQLREIVQYIHDHMFKPGLNVKIVREHCRVRDNNISCRFRHALGLGIKAYIDKHRIAASSLLLEQTDLAIFDIAMAVGYLHVETFYQVFRRHLACTPGNFRLTGTTAETR